MCGVQISICTCGLELSRLHSKMEDTLDSSQRQPLRSSTPPPSRARRNGTAVKFTLVAMIFQLALIAAFSVLVDYGGHSLPPKSVAEQAKVTESNKTVEKRQQAPAPNDISIYYPSKISPVAIWSKYLRYL